MAQLAERTTVSPLVPGRTYRMSFEAFLKLEGDFRAEWEAGEVTIFMPPLLRHVELASWLSRFFGTYLELLGVGFAYSSELLVTLPMGGSRMPDVTVVLHSGQARKTRHGIEGSPDLVVELISQDSVTRDMRKKREVYAKAGIPEYIMFDTRPGKERFYYLRLNAAGTYDTVEPDDAGRYHSAIIAGLWIDPTWLMSEPLPSVLSVLKQIAPEAVAEWARR